MKKIISLGIVSLLMPFMAFAADATVSINSLSVDGSRVTSSGFVTYEGLLTLLTIQIDSSNILQRSQGGAETENWGVESSVSTGGNHTLTAIVSRQDGSNERTASRNFTTAFGGGLSPCQIDGTCPGFGLSAPRIPDQAIAPTFRYVQPGEDGCPAFFQMNCLIK